MDPPCHRLTEFAPLSAHDQELVQGWRRHPKQVHRGRRLWQEGDPVTGVYFLIDGWVASYLSMRSGKRQIAKTHLPGDLMGWPSVALKRTGETLEAITDATVSFISNAELGRLLRSGSDIVPALLLSSQKERVALMSELLWIGASNALARIAALLLDLHDRLDASGRVRNGRFELPLTQQYIGDALGLTSVHVNRTMRKLDEDGLVARGRGWIELPDVPALRRLVPHFPPPAGGREAWLRLFPDDGRRCLLSADTAAVELVV